MNQPQILTIQLGVNGVQLVLNALAKMPFDQVAELIAVIRVQAEQQLNPQPAADPVQPVKRAGGRPKGSKNKGKTASAEAAIAGDNEGATAD
jgi:chromatin remodeling complex protein RSC6